MKRFTTNMLPRNRAHNTQHKNHRMKAYYGQKRYAKSWHTREHTTYNIRNMDTANDILTFYKSIFLTHIFFLIYVTTKKDTLYAHFFRYLRTFLVFTQYRIYLLAQNFNKMYTHFLKIYKISSQKYFFYHNT